MTILAILLAALAGFGTGAVWYMWHAERWMKAVGLTKEQVEADKNPAPFVIGFVASLLTSIMMWHILSSAGITSVGGGLIGGLGLGAFVAAPWILLNYAFAGRPRDLWWIDGLHVVAAQGLIGLVLGLFL